MTLTGEEKWITRHSPHLAQLMTQQLDFPVVGVEVGIWRGQNAAYLLDTFPELYLFMVDPYYALGYDRDKLSGSYTPNGLDRYREWPIREACTEQGIPTMVAARRSMKCELSMLERIAPYRERATTVRMSSHVAARYFNDRCFDFIFIDACHEYTNIKADLNAWYPKLKDGGLFSGHDYDSKWDRKGHYGVKRAVDEFCKERGYSVNIAPQLIWWFHKR